MNSVVLDASAVLAVACREPGADEVKAARAGSLLSAVNHMEVVSKLVRSRIPGEAVEHFLAEVFPCVVSFDRVQAELAARLHAGNRAHQLSYADCACLALAMVNGMPVLTGDRKWAALALDVEVRLFR